MFVGLPIVQMVPKIKHIVTGANGLIDSLKDNILPVLSLYDLETNKKNKKSIIIIIIIMVRFFLNKKINDDKVIIRLTYKYYL